MVSTHSEPHQHPKPVTFDEFPNATADDIGAVSLGRTLQQVPNINPQLLSMLLEHYEHRTERRGAGFTQATRWLAERINRPRSARDAREIAEHEPDQLLQTLREFHPLTDGQAILCDLLRQLIEVRESSAPALNPIAPEKLKIGTCPLAEQFFLEIACDRIRRGGRVNVICTDDGQPLLLEKRGLGDEHSALAIAPVRVYGIELPAGALIGLDYDDAILQSAPDTTNARGKCLSVKDIRCFRFLRLTTLVAAPNTRARVFSSHFDQQIQNALFLPDTTEIATLAQFAKRQVASERAL